MKAAEHYEAFYQLTEGSTWKDETGHTYNSLACEHLWRIYILLADKMLENKEQQQAIKTLIKAIRMAKTGRFKITFSCTFIWWACYDFLKSKVEIVKCSTKWLFPVEVKENCYLYTSRCNWNRKAFLLLKESFRFLKASSPKKKPNLVEVMV